MLLIGINILIYVQVYWDNNWAALRQYSCKKACNFPWVMLILIIPKIFISQKKTLYCTDVIFGIIPCWLKKSYFVTFVKKGSLYWQGSNPKGQADVALSIVLKIHFQFQQSLPKRYISFHGVSMTFF